MSAVDRIKKSLLSFLLLSGGSVFSSMALAGLDNIKIMALSPQDGSAVIQTQDKAMHVVSPGDTFEGSKVMQILSDKVVMQNAEGQMVWVLKSQGQKPSVVKVLQTTIPKEEWPIQ